jgi:alpha-methylacyl-CoA racemase
MSLFYGLFAGGQWQDRRRSNPIDGGAPFYDTYRCADDKWISIGSIEPKFYALLLEKTGAAPELPEPQMQRSSWSAMQQRLRAIFVTKTRGEWCSILEQTDVCFAPVLSMAEAPRHHHHVARGTFVSYGGVVQPAPAPRFSATPAAIRWPPVPIEKDAASAIAAWCKGLRRDESQGNPTGKR